MDTEPFGNTFGPRAQRKRPRLDVGTFEELSKLGDEPTRDPQARPSTSVDEGTHADYIEPIYSKGTSRRIYGELYKVIDSSDIILHVLDARDPMGTMCTSVLDYMKKEKAHKQVVLILNKCDLVPAWVTVRLKFLDFCVFLPFSTVRLCFCTPHEPSQVLPFQIPTGLHCYVRGRSSPSPILPSCLVPRCEGFWGLGVGQSW